MLGEHARRAMVGLAAPLLTGAACGWTLLEPVSLDDAGPNHPLDASGSADVEASLTPDDTADAELADGAPDATQDFDGPRSTNVGDFEFANDASDAPNDSDGASSTAPCTVPGTPVDSWTFDSDVQGWSLLLDPSVEASLSWASAVGDPMPGALEADITPLADAGMINGGWAEYDAMLGDLSGRTASAWVWLDSGAAPHLKLFVQTGSEYVWADGGTVYLQPQTWTCVALSISSPAYQQAMYDPTNVIRIGFEMLADAPFRLYIDTVRVQ